MKHIFCNGWNHIPVLNIYGSKYELADEVNGCSDNIFIWALDANIYMKVLEGITIPKPEKRNMYSVK